MKDLKACDDMAGRTTKLTWLKYFSIFFPNALAILLRYLNTVSYYTDHVVKM